MLATLAHAIGTEGMAGGQAIDLEAIGKSLSPETIERMHRRKTGALIQASVELGAMAAGLGPASGLCGAERFRGGDRAGVPNPGRHPGCHR